MSLEPDAGMYQVTGVPAGTVRSQCTAGEVRGATQSHAFVRPRLATDYSRCFYVAGFVRALSGATDNENTESQ